MNTEIDVIAHKISQDLLKRKWKLVTAESCTGGGIAYYLTNLPGSSEWFDRGFITYSNLSKEEMLGVKRETLSYFGAVSEETAREMAEGSLYHSEAHFSIAVTGIAGPTGGSENKPVGTVWIAFAGKEIQTISQLFSFSGSRQNIREQTIQTALLTFSKLSFFNLS